MYCLNFRIVGYDIRNLKINFSTIGISLFIALSIFNTSIYGASLSWMVPACIFIFLGSVTGRGFITLQKNSLLLLLFWGVFFVSTFFSDIVTFDRSMATFFVFCIIYILAVSRDYSKNQIKLFINIYVLIGIYCSLNIVHNWLVHDYFVPWFARSSFTYKGVDKDPNYVMAFIVPTIAFSLIKFIHYESKLFKLISLSCVFIGVSAMIAAGSRGAMLTFVLFVIVYTIFPTKMSLFKKLLLVVIAILLIYMCVQLIIIYLPEQAIERLVNSADDSRIELWSSSFEVFMQNPILGGGMSAASVVSKSSVIGKHSHNVYLDILCNSGMVGTTIFIIMFLVNCLISTKKNRVFIYGMALSFMFPMLFINGFNTATFYLPLIFLSILSRYCRKKGSSYCELLS